MLRSELRNLAKLSISIVKLAVLRISNKNKEPFTCPICSYHGPFLDLKLYSEVTKHAECPKCGSLERHRLQKLVLDQLSRRYDFSKMRILHFAPESYFRKNFQKIFGYYASADLLMEGVDFEADIRNLPFDDRV